MRRVTVPLLLLLVVMAWPADGMAAAPRCRTLTGTDLAPGPRAKLVEGPNGALLGCSRGRRVHTVAEPGYRLREVVQATVLVDDGTATRVANVRSRSSVTLVEAPDRAVTAHVIPGGTAVAAVRTGGAVEIRRYNPSGYHAVLDSAPAAEIPPADLQLDGTVAHWTHGGEPRTSELAPRGTNCQRLAGTDLSPDPETKLVERYSLDRRQLVGCVLPDGYVLGVASSFTDFAGTADYRLRGTQEQFVLVDQSYARAQGTDVVTRVVSVTGPGYDLAARSTDPASTVVDETAEAAFVSPVGSAVAAVTRPGRDSVSIVGYDAGGTRTVLDTGTRAQIPPASLTLDGTTAAWTHDGAARGAVL